MNTYLYTKEQRSLMEQSRIPFAVYQLAEKRVVTLVLSAGFCELFGYDDHAQAYSDMDHDMYRDTHPDDAARIADAAYRFATEGGKYETIYRSRRPDGDGYNVIHAMGEHIHTDTGERLAQIWYTNEGRYEEESNSQDSDLNHFFNRALHEESILKASYYDYLTGLPSMTYFFQLAEAGRNAILAAGGKPSLLYMDLSGMKYYNSRHGFAAGDKLLRNFAQHLIRIFTNENCSRFGSDHFCVFTEAAGLEEKLEQLFADFAQESKRENLPVRVGIYQDKDGASAVDVSTACDRAKYACDTMKNIYVSSYYYFNTDLLEATEKKQYIIDNLDRAIAERWIKVYYQPIIRAANGRVSDEEALSRWVDPVMGMLSPAEFIPTLEETSLIYKLDLYVTEQILEKMKRQAQAGLFVVPTSVNLSRTDFDACDIVEEIRARVDAAGIDRDKLTIEITESVVGNDFDFIKEQVERFQRLGFRVWMDDFGSGYSSLDVLQSIRFDLIKFDMHFMAEFQNGDKSKIILTELIKMAIALGIDTICEGVETAEQADFLREVGCTKLQGYYYCKPIPFEEIQKRYETGLQIGFENPAEAEYYASIGRINLYDLAIVANEDEDSFEHYFNTLPMAILESTGTEFMLVRCNNTYRAFMEKLFGVVPIGQRVNYDVGNGLAGNGFLKAMRECGEYGNKILLDEEMADGSKVHAFLKRIAVNPATGTKALAVAVLAVMDADSSTPSITFNHVARALSSDYIFLYSVDLTTDRFTEYSSNSAGMDLSVERHGEDFFTACRLEARRLLHEEDQDAFLDAFTKENVLACIDEHGAFTATYRQIIDGVPTYVSMKAVRVAPTSSQIILGVNNVDAQMRQQEALEQIKEEQLAYSRIMALAGDYICIYTVDPVSEHFVEYSAASDYESLRIAKEGDSFFLQCQINGETAICPDDLPMYRQRFTRETVLGEIAARGRFLMQYRLMIDGVPIPVALRATLVHESDGDTLIIGVNRVDEEETAVSGDDREIDAVLQTFVDRVDMPCCVLSVEKTPAGDCGDIRILRANDIYRKAMGSAYYDGMLYQELVPQDNKFEDYCFRAAHGKQRMHAYVEVKALHGWIDQTIIPLSLDGEGLGYCQYIFEYTPTSEAGRMASVSVNTAEKVIKASIKLVGNKDFTECVTDVLADILEDAGAQACRIMLVDHERKEATLLAEHIIPDAWPGRSPTDEIITYDLIKTWEAMIGVSNAVIVKDSHDMDMVEKANPLWAASMRENGVNSLVLIPLRRDAAVVGYLYVVNFDVEKVVEVKELVELMAFFLGGEIANHLLLQKLEMLSSIDPLTGLRNRRAMLQRMKALSERENREPFGVINLDLNGLKYVNDRDGHDAGDRLLIQASELLRKVFYQDDLYRTGGDEFIIITTGISRETFDRKVGRLRSDIKKNADVSFAIGVHWSDGAEDLKTAFRHADKMMYADKESFYENNPDLRRPR